MNANGPFDGQIAPSSGHGHSDGHSDRDGTCKQALIRVPTDEGNQGKTRGFQPKSGEKISNQGTFFSKPFPNY